MSNRYLILQYNSHVYVLPLVINIKSWSLKSKPALPVCRLEMKALVREEEEVMVNVKNLLKGN